MYELRAALAGATKRRDRAPMGANEGDIPIDVRDRKTVPQPGPPPRPGAQWDEVYARWEVWDEAAGGWVVLRDDGEGTLADDELDLPALLVHELVHAKDIDLREHVVDVHRTPEPAEKVPLAQWNEVAARWERWDIRRGAWVEVEADVAASE
jgi:hypothetical protein